MMRACTGIGITVAVSFVSAVAWCDRPLNIAALYSSVGQLCRESECVLVGSLGTVVNSTNAEGLFVRHLQVIPSEILAGNFPSTNQDVYVFVRGGSPLGANFCTAGQTALLFVSRTRVPHTAVSPDSRPQGLQNGSWSGDVTVWMVPGADRGILQLDGTTSSNVITTIRGYLAHTREKRYSATEYFMFLQGQLSNSVLRIQEDAWLNLADLARSVDVAALRIWTDKAGDPETRAYLEKVIAWKEAPPSSGRRAKLPDPTESEISEWRAVLRQTSSDSSLRKLNAIMQLSEPDRNSWLLEHRNLWQDDVAAALADSDQLVRRTAARLLARVDDRRAVPILLDLMVNGPEFTRRSVWLNVKRLSGETISYDPTWPATNRAESVQRWREWWKTQPAAKPEKIVGNPAEAARP